MQSSPAIHDDGERFGVPDRLVRAAARQREVEAAARARGAHADPGEADNPPGGLQVIGKNPFELLPVSRIDVTRLSKGITSNTDP